MLTKEERVIRHTKRSKIKTKNHITINPVSRSGKLSDVFQNQSIIQTQLNCHVIPEELKQLDNHHKSFVQFVTDKTIRYFTARPQVSNNNNNDFHEILYINED